MKIIYKLKKFIYKLKKPVINVILKSSQAAKSRLAGKSMDIKRVISGKLP